MEKQERKISILINICKGVAEDSDAFFNEWYKVQKPKFKKYLKINLYWDLREINLVPADKLIMIYKAIKGVNYDVEKFKCFLLVNGYDTYERLEGLYKKNDTAIIFCKEGETPQINKKTDKKLLFSYFITDCLKDISYTNSKKTQTISYINNFIKSDEETKRYCLEKMRVWFYDTKGAKDNLFEIILTLSNRIESNFEDLKCFYINLKNEIVENGYFKIIETKQESLCSGIINGFTLQFNNSEYEYIKFLVEIMNIILSKFFESKGSLNNLNPFVKDTLLKKLAHWN